MALMGVVVTFSAGEPETGLWCDSCLLPSAVAVPVMATYGSGKILLLQVFRQCTDYGGS